MKIAINYLQRRKLESTAYVLPAFLLHFLVVVVPAFSVVYYALTKWNGLGAPEFVGLANFRRMIFSDVDFHLALVNNVIWTVLFMTVPIITGLLVAMALTRVRRVQTMYRALFFIPYVVSPVIAGKLFQVYYSPFIGISSMLTKLGIPAFADFSWLSPGPALFSVAFVNYWHWWGFVAVVLFSALHQLDPNLYEAAEIEGVNSFQRFTYVTLPQIMPTVVTLLMVSLIGSFLTFDYVWVMTQGGPAGATEVASTWIYKRAFKSFEAGYAAALSFSISALCITFYFGFRALQRRGWDV